MYINNWKKFGYDIWISFRFRKIRWKCSVHLYRCTWINSFCTKGKLMHPNLTFLGLLWMQDNFEFFPLKYLSLSKKIEKDPRGVEPGTAGWKTNLKSTTLSGYLIIQEKYDIFIHSTISIHILAGKIQNCLAFRADPKMSDLDTLIGL